MQSTCDEKCNFATVFLREHRKVWSLQNDVDLLTNIETFSQGLIKRTCFILDSMEEFQREINLTSISVKTLSNNFEAVSDSQFVENRVYDEDDMICEEDKHKNDTTTLNLNKRLEESLKLCARTLESKFEAVSITMSDSEEDVDIFNEGEVILIPKNRYKSRPLPHLVGGEDFYLDESPALLHPSNDSDVDKVFNSEDKIFINSESSGTDEIDSCYQKNDCLKNTENKIQMVISAEPNERNLAEKKEDDWNEINYPDEQYINDNFSESKKELPSTTEHFNPLNFQNIVPAMQMNVAIADEIKGIFGGENKEIQKRFPILKNQSTLFRAALKDIDNLHQDNGNSERPQECECTKNISSSFENSEQSVFTSCVQCKIILPSHSNGCIEEKMSEENILPNIPTEVLHSFAKTRAKIKGKRRLPTKRLRNISHNTEAVIVKQEPKENILSPSTDEEDLFVLPHVNISKESSSNSLFGVPSLFSPGSSIEEEPKQFLHSSTYNQEKLIDVDRKDEKDPLGIKKSSFDCDKKISNLFNDWDPFDSEDSDLFSSVGKNGRKTTLFGDSNGITSEKSIKDNGDDLFLFPSTTASKSSLLFSNSLSSEVGFTSNNVDRNVFSSSHHDDILFGSSENNIRKLNFNVNPTFDSEKSGNKHINDEMFKDEVCSNPLMDTEDLFD